ncbi:MAG: ThiF family adenylyltransferase [Patescibacteria group bacterium]|mgnify:CR=1 FL=1
MEKPLTIDARTEAMPAIRERLKPERVLDTYRLQLEDLFLLRNPKHRFDKNYQEPFANFITGHSQSGSLEACGSWVYFPWNRTLVHYLADADHQEVRTGRNRNLITKEEQDRFYGFRVGVAGLSVGSHGALTTVLMGGARVIKLADPDFISPTNLNRLRFDFTQIGMNKAEAIAQYIYQLNPYAEVILYTDGITEENVDSFMDGIDILVEELDDIEVKVRMREEAKKRKLPVIMATDNSDNVIMDIERFDLAPNSPIFYGMLEGMDLKEIKKSPQKMFEAMGKIIGLSFVPSRALNSVFEVGKTIYSWPQLASAATLSGAVIAYAIRKIALGEKVREGKFDINLEAAFSPDYEAGKEAREKELEKFLAAFSLANNAKDANHG